MFRTLTILATLGLLVSCGDDGGRSDGSGSGDETTTNASDPSTQTAPSTTIPDDDGVPPKADLGVEPPAACDGYCVALSSCLGQSETDCLLQCDTTHADYTEVGGTCVGDYESLLGCVAALDCDQVADFQAGEGDYPCAAQDTATLASCNELQVPQICVDFCATSSMCEGGAAETCEVVCSDAIDMAEETAEACRAAQESVFTCAGALSCEEFADWLLAEGDYACMAQDQQLLEACDPT